MSVSEVWTNFFADDPKFNMEESFADIGDKLKSVSKWGPSSKEKIGSSEVLQQQVIHSKSKVPDTNSDFMT